MGNLVGNRFHSNDDEIIISLLMKKRLDRDFSVQSILEIYISKFENFHLPGLCANQPQDALRYPSCAVTGDGTQKAEWTMHPRLRVKFLRLLNQHLTYDSRNHVAENVFSMVACRELSSHHLPSSTRNHIAENTLLEVEVQQLPSYHIPSCKKSCCRKYFFICQKDHASPFDF